MLRLYAIFVLLNYATLVTALPHEDEPRYEITEVERIRRLIDQLGNETFKKRENASKSLTEIGLPALQSLIEALKSSDPEIQKRANKIIDDFKKKQIGVLRSDMGILIVKLTPSKEKNLYELRLTPLLLSKEGEEVSIAVANSKGEFLEFRQKNSLKKNKELLLGELSDKDLKVFSTIVIDSFNEKEKDTPLLLREPSSRTIISLLPDPK